MSACADKAPTFQRFPPAVDLRGTAKPQAPVDIVTSAKAAADYNIEIETWGEASQRQITRVCRWAKTLGMTDAPC